MKLHCLLETYNKTPVVETSVCVYIEAKCLCAMFENKYCCPSAVLC